MLSWLLFIALENMNWKVNLGENWLVTGPNGSGKSLVTKAITNRCQVLPATSFAVNSEVLSQPRHQVRYVTLEQQSELFSQCDFIQQRGSFNRFVLSDLILKQFLTHQVTSLNFKQEDLPAATGRLNRLERDRSEQLMSRFGLTAKRDEYIFNLSTGEFRKLLIILALSKQPKLLVLDEVFDGLDASAKASLFQVLNDLIKSQDLGDPLHTQLIVISHRKDEVSGLSSLHCLDQSLQLGLLSSDPEKRTYGIVAKGPLCHITRGNADQDTDLLSEPRLLDSLDHSRRKLSETPTLPMNATAIVAEKQSTILPRLAVEIRQLVVSQNDKAVLHLPRLEIPEGGHLLVEGENGAGKSFLLRLLANKHPVCHRLETISLFGQTLKQLNQAKHAPNSQSTSDVRVDSILTSQAEQLQLFNGIRNHEQYLTVEEYLAPNVSSINLEKGPQVPFTDVVLDALNINHLVASKTFCVRLSQGEQRKVYLAKQLFALLAQRHSIQQSAQVKLLLLLDEPFHGLDTESRANLKHILEQLITANCCTLVLVTHREDEVPRNITHRVQIHKPSA